MAALVLTGVAVLAAAGVVGPAPPLLLAAAALDEEVLEPGTEAAVRTGVLVVAFEFLRARALPFLPFSADPSLGVFRTFEGAGDPPWLALLLLPPDCCCCRFIAVMRGEGDEMEAAPGGPIPPALVPICEVPRCIPGRWILAGEEPIWTDEK